MDCLMLGKEHMKAITLTQPWATLVAIGEKQIETRSWSTLYRGPLAIHAAAGFGPIGGKRGYMDLCSREPFKRVLTAYWKWLINSNATVLKLSDGMPRGAIVARCELIDCVPTEFITEQVAAHYSYRVVWNAERIDFVQSDEAAKEIAFGDYTPGRYAWLLAHVQMLPEPIQVRGALGLWEWSEK
jgi:hypothetical protein